MSKTAETDLLNFLYACPVGLLEFDAHGEIGMINPNAMKHLLPLSPSGEMENFFLATEQYAPELRNMCESFERDSGPICDGHRIVTQLTDGGRRGVPTVIACSMVRLGADRFMATLSDISQQVLQEMRLRQADAWLAALVGEINDHALIILSEEGRILSVSPSFTRQTGLHSDAVIGRSASRILTGLEDAQGRAIPIDEQLAMARRDGWHLFEGWEKRRDGEAYWAQRLIVPRGENYANVGQGFSLVLRDVPVPEEGSEDLVRLLTRDHLTGAANRMQFNKVLKQERLQWKSRHRSLSLLMLDLDHFKVINDEHGHAVGDRVLKMVAEKAETLLPGNASFARLGGEEFGVIVPNQALTEALTIAEELRAAIGDLNVPASCASVSVTASIGCANMDETDGSIDELLKLADERLYAAKHAGRNRVLASAV